MEKKNNFIITILTIAMLLFITISATYAYFSSSQNMNNLVINASMQANKASFTSYVSDQIELNVSSEYFVDPSTMPSVSDNGIIYVEFVSNSNEGNMHCTYDINLVWDSEQQYTAPSFPLPYEGGYNFELSILGNRYTENDSTGVSYQNKDLNEINISNLSWIGEEGSIGRYAVIVDNAEIYSTGTTSTKTTWTFTVNFYTLPELQSGVMGKDFSAHLEVSDIVC